MTLHPTLRSTPALLAGTVLLAGSLAAHAASGLVFVANEKDNA